MPPTELPERGLLLTSLEAATWKRDASLPEFTSELATIRLDTRSTLSVSRELNLTFKESKPFNCKLSTGIIDQKSHVVDWLHGYQFPRSRLAYRFITYVEHLTSVARWSRPIPILFIFSIETSPSGVYLNI